MADTARSHRRDQAGLEGLPAAGPDDPCARPTPASRSAKGEFVCLIGASGCGKSTLLRIMAGFEQPSSGEALMWGKPIDEPDPSRGMVFQDYALFPWLSVRDNIAFGPIARGLASAEVKATVDKFIELVGLRQIRQRLSAPALRRHEAARGDRPRARQRRRAGADGRAVRRARRHDARAPAGRAAGDLAAHAVSRWSSSPTRSRRRSSSPTASW